MGLGEIGRPDKGLYLSVVSVDLYPVHMDRNTYRFPEGTLPRDAPMLPICSSSPLVCSLTSVSIEKETSVIGLGSCNVQRVVISLCQSLYLKVPRHPSSTILLSRGCWLQLPYHTHLPYMHIHHAYKLPYATLSTLSTVHIIPVFLHIHTTLLSTGNFWLTYGPSLR